MASREQSRDAIALLKEDHERVRDLLGKLEKSTERASETREKLLARIEQEIRIHTTIEEEIFYPAYKEAVKKREDAKLYQEAIEEHHVADVVMTEIKASDTRSEEFSAKAKVLKDVIEHHAEEEETQMFPRARKAMDAAELRDLGRKLAERKKEMQDDEKSWLPDAGKLIAAVASKAGLGGGSGRSRAAAPAARGAARKKASKSGGATGRSRAKSAKARGSKAGGAKSRGRARSKK